MQRPKMLLVVLASAFVFTAPIAVCMQKTGSNGQEKPSFGEVMSFSFNFGFELLKQGFFKDDSIKLEEVFKNARLNRVASIISASGSKKEIKWLKRQDPREFGRKKKI